MLHQIKSATFVFASSTTPSEKEEPLKRTRHTP